MDRASRLQQVQFFEDFEHDIRYFARSVATIGLHATYINIGKVVVRTAFLCRNTHFRRCRMVVYLNKEARHQFLCLLAGQSPVFQSLFIERSQMLVEVSRIHGIPSIQFRDCPKVNEPIHLDSLPEVARRMSRHPATNFSNALQFRLANRVCAFLRHLFSQISMTFSE